MKEKYIQLIEKQMEKLNATDFDLDAWKSSTIYLLNRIFGSHDPKITEINDLKIDYSSWALRDSNAKYKPIESCKRKGKEILEIAKDEIEFFGEGNGTNRFGEKLQGYVTAEKYQLFMAPDSTESIRTEILNSLTKEKLIELINSLV